VTYQESTKSRDYEKQPYWALHTNCGSVDVGGEIFILGHDITCSANCKYRTAATLYILEARFVSGTSLQITCIKQIN
jgi:hypothetical protein